MKENILQSIKGAIFDLDGTLLNSMSVWEYVDEEFLKRHSLPAVDDYLEKLGPMGFHRAAIYTKDFYQMTESVEEILNEWMVLAKDAYDHTVQLKEGAFDFLRSLHEKGVKIAAATSNHLELFEGTLRRCGIYPFFDAFAVTSEVNRNKDFPDVYFLAAERIGVAPSEAAVFEDILAGIRGAKAGGFRTVAVAEPLSVKDEPILRQEADLYIESFLDIL